MMVLRYEPHASRAAARLQSLAFFMPAVASAPPLSRLRSDLARLRRRRVLVRLGSAAAAAGILLVVVAAVVFGADYFADLRPGQRAILLVAAVVATAWAAKRLVVPWLDVRETEADVALLVGHRQGLDGDLVAALQFQSPEASGWGSPQLERAVVSDVDEASRGLSVFDGFTWKPLPGRLALLCVALAAVAIPAALFPRHAAAFLSRLAMTDTPYPTRTVIASIVVNGKAIDLDSDAPLSAPAGAALTFAARTSGVRPAGGEILLVGDGGGRTALPLKAGRASEFTGGLPAFVDPVTFVVRLGDAKTRPRRIEIVPLPAVTIDLKPTAPAYARTNAPAAPPPGVRTAFVLEGSDVEIVVRATNKALDRVALRIDKQSFPLRPSADAKTWTLPPAGTPLNGIREPIDFVVSVTDADGLSPAEPLKGAIRLRADRPPRVAAGAVVHRVLPTGRPELTYGAADDYGVKAIVAKVAARHADGKVEERTVPLPLPKEPANEVQGRHALDLSAFGLDKGDTVVVTVEATDARGDRPGETATAEPITFEVTDREGLIAALRDTDEEGAQRLDEIIRRELGIGGER